MQRRQLLLLGLSSLAVSACKTQSGYEVVFNEPPRQPAGTATPVASPTAAVPPTAVPSPRPAAIMGATDSVLAQPTSVATVSRPALRVVKERVLVRAGSSAAPLTAIGVATGAAAYTIPADLATPDGLLWIGLHTTAGNTAVTLYAARDGSPVRAFWVPGRYSEGAVSHDSRRLLLVAPPLAADAKPVSELALVDLTSGAVLLYTTLAGRYRADTVDPANNGLYLIAAHPERQHNAYEVTRYDAISKVVSTVADKRSAQTIMSGYKVNQVWSKTGEWLYSLYLSPGADGAFIHALNVAARFAVCIDLPGGNASEAQLQQYALAITPAGDRVFAVNPALSVINTFSVGDFGASSSGLQLPSGAKVCGATLSRPINNCLVAPDGATLYAGTAQGILVVPTAPAALQPKSVWLAGQSIYSLGMGASGALLYALVDGTPRRLLALDARSGAVQADLTGSIAQPVSIDQVVTV
ncbi:MAG: hypothetical protein ACR2JY_24010 [Chloroflexota bacterium]